MNRYQKFMQRMEGGEPIMIDGATGTEIERRGVPMVDEGWNAGGVLTDPDIVRGVHEDYIRCGAQIVISNTFSSSLHVLRDAGLEAQFELLNRRAIELAREARSNAGRPDVLVAGGIAYWSFTQRFPTPDALRDNVEQQARIMADAGADLIILEMMDNIERTMIMIAAARTSDLPVWVGLTCKTDAQGAALLRGGQTLSAAIDMLKGQDVPFLFIMHTEVTDVDACLDVVQREWPGPAGVYAHSGNFISPNWIFTDTISPEDYAAAAAGWSRRGLQVIGGCCGIGVEHIKVLKEAIGA